MIQSRADIIPIFAAALPEKSWTADTDIITPHLSEWRDRYHGHTPIMLTPHTTREVAQMLRLCAAHKIAVVPQGGNTGLVGGQTPMGEVLLSLKKMTAIRQANPITNALIAEAGATLGSIHETASTIDRQFPLFLASQDGCTIGGNLSTNAGGNHVLKYGTTKDLVFGVEAVLANGDIYNGLTDLRKDNTGYDLSRLFLGAEGTLGIITAASLKLFPKPAYVQRAMIALDSPAAAMALLGHCRSEALSMFEVIPAIGLMAVVDNIPDQSLPFDAPPPWAVIIDWDADSAQAGQNLAETTLAAALDAGLIRDAVIAQSGPQAAQILSLREHMSAGQKYLGGSIKFDITVPLHAIAGFLIRADAAMQKASPGCRPVGFGHFGDGNIHYNIAQPIDADKETFLAQWQTLSDIVFDIVGDMGGSISAEHGIGVMKKADLARRADPVKLSLMRAIKHTLDPDNILNPRVML